MNFDDLKKDWDTENSDNIKVHFEEKEVKVANNAIDKVRKNMRFDFYSFIMMSILALVIVVGLPFVFEVHNLLYFVILIFFLLGSFLSIYFITKFYKFYKRSYNLAFDAKDNLMWFYFELRYYIDFYYTFNLVSFVMGLAAGLTCGFIGGALYKYEQSDNIISNSMQILNGYEFVFLIGMIIITIMGAIGMHYLVQAMYGKYLKQIKNTLHRLDVNV